MPPRRSSSSKPSSSGNLTRIDSRLSSRVRGAQLGNILGYVEKLKAVDVSQVEPTAHAVPLLNVTRPDEVRPSLSNDAALRNAPAQANGLFIVPKIVE